MAMEGIVKKLENDKYLFVIKQQYTKENSGEPLFDPGGCQDG